ncbi:MAG: FtsX-like permease family protein, partial [Bacteroidota bacterium]
GSFSWDGMDAKLDALVSTFSADEDLLTVFDLEMVEGRWFKEGLGIDSNNIIINQAIVKKYNIPPPIIGKKIKFQGREGQIIGIAKDFNYKDMHEKIGPLVISYNDIYENVFLAKVNANNINTAIKKTKEIFKTTVPNIPFEYSFMDKSFEQMHIQEAKTNVLFQLFAGLLIFISCLGLFGLATFSVERRTKEIGIRKVLGASAQLIVGLLSKDFLKLVLIALIVAIPIAWYLMDLWLQDFAYHIDIKWWIFILAGTLAVFIAFLTVSFQSLKAAMSNPVSALRNE